LESLPLMMKPPIATFWSVSTRKRRRNVDEVSCRSDSVSAMASEGDGEGEANGDGDGDGDGDGVGVTAAGRGGSYCARIADNSLLALSKAAP
jgi:hypothetical protein